MSSRSGEACCELLAVLCLLFLTLPHRSSWTVGGRQALDTRHCSVGGRTDAASLCCAVFRLRELSNVEKQENQRLQKQLDAQKTDITGLTRDREKLQKDVGRLEAEVIELKEMVR